MNELGTGAIEGPHDPRNFNLAFIAGAPSPVDWSREFRLPEPPDSDQRRADCCVGEATAYMNWQLTGKRMSVRSVFAYIAGSYGAALQAGPHRVYVAGQETFEEAPDPNPKTMKNMRDKSGLNPSDALDDKILRYFDTTTNPDQIAQAVRDWQGAIFGLTVGATGWEDLTNPKPPKPNAGGEGHALYAFGYHMHDVGGAKQKCIIAKSSWCRNGHHEHHIKQDYFNSGYVFNRAYVMVPKEKLPMVTRYRVRKGSKLGVCVSVDGSFDDVISWAKSEAHLAELMKQKEIPADAPEILYP